ncbi:MAG: hypothetical protein Q9220_007241 [cf. Caloplaca sp. 1 TL-2023]
MPRIEDANGLSLLEYRSKLLPPSVGPIIDRDKPQQSYDIRFESSSTLSYADANACFDLIASSSANAYAASSIGWSPAKKRKEMKLPDLRYLLLFDSTTQDDGKHLGGFLSFMLTYEDSHEVIYCYEVHLAPQLQRKGIGKHFMSMMEEVGKRAGVEKSMLTVFVENQDALAFYGRLGYSKDEYSPEPRTLRNGKIKMPTYVILSKSLRG